MTLNRTFLALLTLGILGGGTALVQAQATRPTSSIQVAQGRDQDKQDKTEQEGQEDQDLQALAKIPLSQAIRAAEQRLGGKATQAELENEDGNLVYSVEVKGQEVLVDAGTGQVLSVKHADTEEED